MNNFTEVYQKASDVIKNQNFSAVWNDFLKIKNSYHNFFGSNGFEYSQKNAPEKIRSKIRVDSGLNISGAGKTQGVVIYDAAKNDSSIGTLAERAATIKMLQHLYLVLEKGAQQVWVYSPPKQDTKWVFDEINGSDSTMKARLDRSEEIFTAEQMKWMSSALGLSLKISEDCKVKVKGEVTQQTKDIVKKWFLDSSCSDIELNNALSVLSAGFNKISVGLSKNTLVFTDYADWRAKRDRFYGAAIPGGEGGRFPVIYLEGAFTRLTGNSGQLWLCAETIIHEMSHHELSTDDHKYDSDGLKPCPASLPYSKAIDNADSWGYFALDLSGYLSVSDSLKVWK